MSAPTAAQASTMARGDIDSFRAILTGAKRIVVLAGAGLSAASGIIKLCLVYIDAKSRRPTGIPTFRGNGGLWRKRDVLSLSTPAAFIDNPSRSWQFHHYLREM